MSEMEPEEVDGEPLTVDGGEAAPAEEAAAVEEAAPVEEPDNRQPITDHSEADAELNREVRRMSRRGFLTMAVAAGAAYGAWKWLGTRPLDGGVPWPLRRALETNEALAMAYFSRGRLSPTFAPSRITKPRVNGNLGLDPRFDLSAWRLQIEGAASPVSLTLDDLRAFPRREMITELRCIEGWSIIVQWAGARLADVMQRFPSPAPARYLAMETPDRGYYVGLDMQSAQHPQTLLAYEMNGRPLLPQHGAPLRLAIPVKYGVKNLKRIGTIRYTNVRPADFWGERGYDWYCGH